MDITLLTAANNFLAWNVFYAAAWTSLGFLYWRHGTRGRPWDEWSDVITGLSAALFCFACIRQFWWLYGVADARNWTGLYTFLLVHRWIVGLPTVGAVVAIAVVMSLFTRRWFGRLWFQFSFAILTVIWLAGLAIAVA